MIKTLLKCVREYKKSSFLTMFFIILEVVLEALIPFYMADLIDYGFKEGNMPFILKTGGVLLFFAFLSLAAGTLAAYTGSKASTGFAKNLRSDMYKNIQRFSFSNIDRFSTASIITRLTTDVSRAQMMYMMALRIALRAPVMMIFAIVMTTFISWKIAIVFFVAVPLLSGGLLIIAKFVHPIFTRVFKAFDKLNRAVQENLHGIRVVKSFVRQEHEKKKFDDAVDKIHDDFVKGEKILAWNNPFMTACIYGVMLVICFIGAYLIVGNERVTVSFMGENFTTGLLNSIMTYAMQVLMNCQMVSMIFLMLTMTRESLRRISEVLKEEPDLTNPENPVSTVKDGSIDFNNVSFAYKKGGEFCLKNVNLNIPSGATVGIIGGTGSSKSTLVQLIPRLYDVTEGSLKIGGVDVRDYDLYTLRDPVSMVLQKNQLFFGSIADNLRWGNENATEEDMIRACKQACMDEFIQELPDKYDYHIDQGGTNVSGGQKQRLCIARALLKNPKILILDDSTSAVDTATDAKIRYSFKNEIPNTTKIIIAQRISSVMDADIIVVMDEGRINAVGTHDELLKTNRIYSEVFYSQQKGGAANE